MKQFLFLNIVVLAFANQSFGVECSAWIQEAVQPPVPNIQVQLTKKIDQLNWNLESFTSGGDEILRKNKLRVFIDVNRMDKSVKVLIGQRSGSVSSFLGAIPANKAFRTSYSFNRTSELVIECKE